MISSLPAVLTKLGIVSQDGCDQLFSDQSSSLEGCHWKRKRWDWTQHSATWDYRLGQVLLLLQVVKPSQEEEEEKPN